MPAKIASRPEPVMQLVGSGEFVAVEIRVSRCEDRRRRRTAEDHFARKRPFVSDRWAEIRISREDFKLVLGARGNRPDCESKQRQHYAISQAHGFPLRACWPGNWTGHLRKGCTLPHASCMAISDALCRTSFG